MKKLLTFLTLLMLFFTTGWAADETITFSDLYSSNTTLDEETISGDNFSIVFQKRSGGTATQYYTNGYAVRWYGGGTLTVSSSTKTITKIEITFTQTANSISANVGSYSLTNSVGTWQGSASSIVLTQSGTSGHCRISSIAVTYAGSAPQPTTYSITGTGAVTGGSVTASATSNIAEGTSITITATPSTGYDLSNLTVDGNDVTSSVNSSYEYTFNMPSHDVAVAATFTDQSVTPTTSTTFELINSTSDLEAGKRYILVYEGTPSGMGAITTSGTKFGTSVTGSGNITITNGVATLPSGSEVKPLTLGGTENAWTFDLDGALLSHISGNSLTTGNSNNTWEIAFNGNNVVITNTRIDENRIIKYNTGSPRFACYTSGQASIQLYKEVESTTSNKLYLIGQDMYSQSGWNISSGPEFTYSNSAGTYAVDAYFDMASRGYFQFVEGLSNSNSNWGGLTGRYYASGDGDVAVDNFDMDGTVPLYFTNSTQYSPGQYAFTVPAGIYTIVVDKANWQIYVTQHEVTMEISPNSATFETTKNVTLSSNLTALGGKIYYTTDGTTPSASNGTEYTGGNITLEATTTIKAIAILNYIQSEVVEKTYTKTPAAPEISPTSRTFSEPFQVTITAESGADIYYTTDGTDPKDSETRTKYESSFTVSNTTTVKARAFFGEVYGAITTATYTYSNVQPSTDDFELVTSVSQLVEGNEYIIVAKYNGINYAMGTISNNKGQSTNDFTLDGTIGVSGSTIAAGTAVNVFTLEASDSNWKFKLSDNSYIEMPSSTNITTGNSGTAMTITFDNNLASIVGTGTTTRLILFSSSNSVFGNYASSNAGASGYSSGVYLYTRASNAVQNPVFSPVPGIYNVDIDVTISCATDGATIYYTTDGNDPTATTGTQYTGEIMVSASTTFKAIAVKDGNTSSVVTAEYTIQKSTDIETVTLTYSEPFTQGIGKFTINNESGFSPVWSLDGNYGVKGTSYSNGTNYAAVSRLVSPIIDMTGSVQPELSFSHQINSYFTNPTTQCQVFIRETTNGTSGTWVQIPITFSDPVAAGGWTNDLADIDLTDVNGVSYADKKVQISFLYTNPEAGTGAGTWEIQNFMVADNSEYRLVNNIAEFLALEDGTKAKFKNPVTVLYDYAQYSSSQYHEYIWVKDASGYMQFYMVPTLNYDENNATAGKAAYYENGDIIPAGFVVKNNYYEYGKYYQAYTNDALNAGFESATQKGLADPEFMDFDTLNTLDATNDEDVATWCNHYITLEKIKIASKSGKNFTFANENGTVNACVGYNKYNGDGSLLKGGTTSADVTVPAAGSTYYNVKGIIQLWQGGWEFMPVEFTEWKAEEVTLRKLCADGVVNNEYTISNNLLGVYAKGNTLWVKDDDDQSIWSSEPSAPNKENFAINFPENTRSEQAHYAQSNWCEIELTSSAAPFVGEIIKGGSISGTFTKKLNPTMTGVTLTEDDVYASGSYAPNYYVAANFQGSQNGYFFMNPKPQEYAHVVWAIYDATNEVMKMTTNTAQNPNGFTGSFKINLDLNSDPDITLVDGVTTGKGYENFEVIVRLKSTGQSGAPRLMPANSEYEVFPLNISNPTPTGIDNIVNGKAVKSVKYVNVAGIMSDTPFQGVNIVVTEYTDGSRSTTKMLRK